MTASYLSLASDQWVCRPENKLTNYCTAVCQEGTNKIQWHAFDSVWCSDARYSDACKPPPPYIPYNDFHLKSWTEAERIPKPCESLKVTKADKFKISVGILARGNELETLQLSVNSWVQFQLFDYVDEIIFMINEKSEEMLNYIEDEILSKRKYNVRVLASETNVGILNGINYLLGNATNEYMLFLEKDFRLVEPIGCTVEQIRAGLNLLSSKKADVVKYRSRHNPGRPNWADVTYRGREDDVFGIQPNLLCNFYHWIDDPDKRWPNHFKVCSSDPTFYCVDSEFCNWTNNPFIISKYWWFEQYVFKFPEIANSPPDFNLEGFMNWHPGAWNTRKFTVAEGDGLFKHCDANNFGQ